MRKKRGAVSKLTSIVLLVAMVFSLMSSPVFVNQTVYAESGATKELIKLSTASKAVDFERQMLKEFESEKVKLEYRGVLSNWATKEVSTAIQVGLVPDTLRDYFVEPINRLEFAELAVQSICTLSGVSRQQLLSMVNDDSYFSDCSNDSVAIAAALGIVNGMPNGNYEPYGQITRQEAAAMLSRTSELLGYRGTDASPNFSDTSGLWGKSYISSVASMNDPYFTTRVMNGVGNGKFGPKELYSREQAIITMLRLANSVVGQCTGYDASNMPVEETVDNSQYNAQNIDDNNFLNGNWVREDGEATLIISHESSPDVMDFTINVKPVSGKKAYNVKSYADLQSNKLAVSVENGLSFNALGNNRMKVASDWLDELYSEYSAPDGIYVLERVKDVGDQCDQKPNKITSTGMEPAPGDDPNDENISAEGLLINYISAGGWPEPINSTPEAKDVLEKIKEDGPGSIKLKMKGTRTCKYYYWTDEERFTYYVGSSIYSGMTGMFLCGKNKSVMANVEKHKKYLRTLPVVGDTTDLELFTQDDLVATRVHVSLGRGPLHRPAGDEVGWYLGDHILGGTEETIKIDPEKSYISYAKKTIESSVDKYEKYVDMAYKLKFSTNEQGKLIADGIAVETDWSSFRGYFEIHLEEE